MTELLQVGDTLRALRILDDWHGHLAGTSSSLNFFFDGIMVNKYLENRIFTCIVSPEEMADKASEELTTFVGRLRPRRRPFGNGWMV